jgi:hypothetical protein
MLTALQRTTSPWERRAAELSQAVDWKTDRRWQEKPGRHINVYEFRAWVKLLKRLASRRSCHHRRVLSLWGSRVAMAVAGRGRSSSRQLLGEMRRALPHLSGGDLDCAGVWIPSEIMPMDQASRGGAAPRATRVMDVNFHRLRPLITAKVINDYYASKTKGERGSIAAASPQ